MKHLLGDASGLELHSAKPPSSQKCYTYYKGGAPAATNVKREKGRTKRKINDNGQDAIHACQNMANGLLGV
jgi:hypothetical protein